MTFIYRPMPKNHKFFHLVKTQPASTLEFQYFYYVWQKKFRWAYTTSELFQKSKILTISKIYELRVLIHAHNTYHNITNTHNSMYNTRNSFCCDIPIPLFKTSSGQKTIEYQESSLWNTLPLCLKQIENPIAFKREMKRHLLG